MKAGERNRIAGSLPCLLYWIYYASGSSLRFFLELGEDAEHREDGERDDQKVDDALDEVAVAQCGFRGDDAAVRRVDRLADDPLPVGHIETTDKQADKRHNHIIDQRGDNLVECAADDHADRHVNDIAFCNKFLEISRKLTHMFLRPRQNRIFLSLL